MSDTIYSQYSEQQHILEACPQASGNFMDIGCWNAKEFSNTRALYEKGWSGIVIEPSPGPLLGLLAEYGSEPRIIIIGAAVTIEPGLVEFYASDDAISTTEGGNFAAWEKHATFRGSFLTPGLSLRQLFERFGGDFGFISIDTEGTSVDLFHNMLEIGPRPRCVCVEHDNRMSELCSAATGANYRLVYSNGTNAVFAI